MSEKGGGGVGAVKGNNGISAIPSGSRKIVMSLKEIVNCPEIEIYAMLRECNMDPNDAVNRLLAQDPFHEVKSKREKKKENKDTSDSRSRYANNPSRGGRGGTDRRSGSTQFTSSESGVLHVKPAYKKENGSRSYTGYSLSTSGVAGNNIQRQPPPNSDSVTIENKMSAIGTDSISTQAASGCQPAWFGVPGQVSMADIVKMGRAHGKASVNHHSAWPASTYQDHLQDHSSKVPETKYEAGVGRGQHVHPNDAWTLVEQPLAPTASSVLETPSDSELYANSSSSLTLDRNNQHLESHLDEYEETKEYAVENLLTNDVGPASISIMQEGNSGDASPFQNELYKNINSYDYEHDEAEDGVASVSVNLQQLNLQKDECGVPSEEDTPSVIIPNHLQVHNSECSYLSFGSFGSGGSGALSGAYGYRPEEKSRTDSLSATHSDTKNSDYYGDEQLRTSLDESLAHRTGASAVNYDTPSASEEEVLKQETCEAAQANQYAFPSSSPDYTFDEAQHMNAAFTHPQTNSQIQNLPPFSKEMQAYTNTLPSTLLASTAQGVRESDLPYSPFLMSQSMSTKYENATSISGSTIPMPESLRSGSTPAPQPNLENLHGASITAGPALPQHLAMHPYSQSTLPLGQYANMISYPFLPQSYAYMPSAYQQAFAGNSTYHPSLAAVLPQYKNTVSVSSLPQSAPIASGYGFGGSTNIPGNFPLNPPAAPAAPAGTTMGYDDAISSQYKDNSHLISLQQNDNSAMWIHGPGSRTMSSLPASTYYSFQGQNQQPSGFRQGQQPSQHYSALGYPNFYHSQTGISIEHQQQNLREGSLSGSQGQPSKQSQQMWQNNY